MQFAWLTIELGRAYTVERDAIRADDRTKEAAVSDGAQVRSFIGCAIRRIKPFGEQTITRAGGKGAVWAARRAFSGIRLKITAFVFEDGFLRSNLLCACWRGVSY